MTLYIFHFHARSRDFALEYGKRLFCIEHDEMAYRHEPLDVRALLGHTRTRIRRSKSAEVARRSPIACRQPSAANHTSGCAPTGSHVRVRPNTHTRHGDLCTVHSMNSEPRDRVDESASRDLSEGKMTRREDESKRMKGRWKISTGTNTMGSERIYVIRHTYMYAYIRVYTYIYENIDLDRVPETRSGFWERFAGIRSRLGRGGNDRAAPSERLPRHERTPSNKPATSRAS